MLGVFYGYIKKLSFARPIKQANSMEKHQLSKSTFIRGVQCLKSLYLYKNRYFLRDALSAEQRAKFVRGIDVGIIAQSLFPGGVNCQPASPSGYQKSVLKTGEIIQNGTAETIYEAAFQFDRVLILLDILAKVDGQWNAYEIKSSRQISETFLLDAALQYYVLKNSGIRINRFFLVHLNGNYEFDGSLDMASLFTFVDVTDKISELQYFVISKIEEEKSVITLKNSPKVEIGLHCNRPYPCDFIGHCWKNVPSGSIFGLSAFSDEEKFESYNQGIVFADDFSAEQIKDFDPKKRIEISAIKEQRPFLDKEKLSSFLGKIDGNVGLIWFLGHRPAVPAYEKLRPYDLVPVCAGFQNPTIENPEAHFWFVENPDENPDTRLFSFLEKLSSSVDHLLVYQADEIKEYLQHLTVRKPEMAEKTGFILQKITDLADVFSYDMYFHPALQGDFDLKNIAGKLLNPGYSKMPAIKSDVLAINEYLKYSVAVNQSEKDLLSNTIRDYGRFRLNCLEGFYRFLQTTQ
jgi:hypothetical protein